MNGNMIFCELCGGEALATVTVESGHSIMKCRTCGLVQVRPLPAAMETGNQAYWRTDLDHPAVQRSRKGDAAVYQYGLDRLCAITGKTLDGMKILDVGCGMGVFLEVVKEQGGIPYGLDLSEDAVAYTRKHVGIDALTVGDFERSELPDAPFDIITGWNVLEHVRHPKAWLQKAHSLLKPGGLILIKVPNVAFSGLIVRHAPLLKKLGLPTTSYLATRPPLHLYGFSTSTLKTILEASGFEVLSVERSRTRDQGLKGLVVAALASLIQFVTLGNVNLHPLIMAIGRRR